MRSLSLLVLLSSLAWSSGRAQSFTKLSFQADRDTVAGNLHLLLAGPDNPARPTAWEGPLSISQPAGSCSVNASLVHDVYLSSSGELVVVVSVSGSDTYVQFFDSRTCAGKWTRLKAFTRGASIQGRQLTLLPACECLVQGKDCTCHSASVYNLAETRAPILQRAGSRALTRRELGLAFTGTRSLARPPIGYAP